MNWREVTRIVRAEHGDGTLSQVGRDGLDDLIWDACPEYQAMTPEERTKLRDAVGEEIFG